MKLELLQPRASCLAHLPDASLLQRFFVCPRSNVVNQSGSVSSAGLPEIKCREQIRTFSRTLLLWRQSLNIAARKPACLPLCYHVGYSVVRNIFVTSRSLGTTEHNTLGHNIVYYSVGLDPFQFIRITITWLPT